MRLNNYLFCAKRRIYLVEIYLPLQVPGINAENSLHLPEPEKTLFLQSFAGSVIFVLKLLHCISDTLSLTLARKMKEPVSLFGVSAINKLKSEVNFCPIPLLGST